MATAVSPPEYSGLSSTMVQAADAREKVNTRAPIRAKNSFNFTSVVLGVFGLYS